MMNLQTNYWTRVVAAMVLLAALKAWDGTASPVLPGYERLRTDNSTTAEFRGELLLGELGCVNCHKAGEVVAARLGTPTAPDLTGIGARVTPQWLTNYLLDTHGVKDGGKMPDIFHSSAPQAKAGAIRFLVDFLSSRGGPIEPATIGGTETMVERGRTLFHSVGCVACHAPEGVDVSGARSVPLPDLAAKTTVDQLVAFLLDPTAHRPSGRMPSLKLEDAEARDLAVYLLRGQMEAADADKPAQVEGIGYEYYEVSGLSAIPDYDSLEPVQKGVVREFSVNIPSRSRNDGFAIRFRASLDISEEGNYRFWTSSDDGSRLLIDGNVVVDNDGIHPNQVRNGRVQLSRGSHDLEVLYFEGGGEEVLQVQWAGPGIQRGPIPIERLTTATGIEMRPTTWTENYRPDPNNAGMGSRMFAAMRCVNCHEMPGIQPMSPAPDLADLNVDNPQGCLGDNLSRRAPQYRLTQDQKSDMAAAVRSLKAGAEPLSPAATVKRTMASFNCYACHQRDGIGGPDESRRQFFTTNSEIDLGEEGSIPPHLNFAGAKFKPAALKRIITRGELHVRHYMTTRMPMFAEEHIEPFLTAIHQVDAMENNSVEPPFSEERIDFGRKFVGVTGVACVTCHGVAGQKGIGINGIDLSTAYSRLQPGWFQKFLLAPADFNPGTRMPNFWPGGQTAFPDILGGSSTAQIQSIWSYLSLGKTMPLPEGIVPEGTVAMELIPSSQPIVHRTFMEDVGPRAILTGYPQKLNLAFDANIVRLAKLWRGRFFDASGVASGRTDRFLSPLGTDVLDLPAGPAVAILDSANASWPQAGKTSRDIGGDFKGYTLDEKMQPVFRYRLNSLEIEEYPQPVLEPGGPSLKRQFMFSGQVPDGKSAWLLMASGTEISKTAGGYLVDGKVAIETTIPDDSIRIIDDGSVRRLQARVEPQSNPQLAYKIKW